MAADALIFDLDGTVWDSAPWFAGGLTEDLKSARDIARQLVAGANIVGVLRHAGLSRSRMLRQAHERNGPPPLFDGMRQALATIRSRGTPLAVATSLPGSIALPMLRFAELGDVFDTVVHAGVCRAAKPSPASILSALRMIGREPTRSVFYVGDRATDAEAASRAGVQSAWVRHGYERPGGTDTVIIAAAGLVGL